MMKNLKPIMFENSRVPVWLSYLAPIEIWAISFGWFVWCRGVMSEATRRHETIHFQQQLELLFVGQWILYVSFWLFGLVKYRKGDVANRENPLEREAYNNDTDPDYLKNRKRFNWINYIKDNND